MMRLFPLRMSSIHLLPRQIPVQFKHLISEFSARGRGSNLSFQSRVLRHTAVVDLKQHELEPAFILKCKEDYPSLSLDTISFTSQIRHRNLHTMSTKIEANLENKTENINCVNLDCSPVRSSIVETDLSSLPTRFGKQHKPLYAKRKKLDGDGVYPNIIVSSDFPMDEPFDICQSYIGPKLSSNVSDEGNSHQVEHSLESIGVVLRPGMVLLKNYITHNEQIEIVKKSRELGLGPGGFYCPSYRNGGKLRLQMMCLGLDWDLETRKYSKMRTCDGSIPYDIPCGFSSLVKRAIQDSHFLINGKYSTENAEEILPRMFPDVCIVNFYTISGRLGLHQDRDESEESLHKGLPVVSFSIGDSAVFLYGDHRNINKAEKVILKSGDVLIFGGKSRHIFHGVSSIIPNSAPMVFQEEAELRPGRLNLTFRKY